MDNTSFKSAEGRSITIIPKGYAENRSYVRKLSSLLMLIFAGHLFLGGLFFYGWYFFEGRRFQFDGVRTIGTIDSWCTHTDIRRNYDCFAIIAEPNRLGELGRVPQATADRLSNELIALS